MMPGQSDNMALVKTDEHNPNEVCSADKESNLHADQNKIIQLGITISKESHSTDHSLVTCTLKSSDDALNQTSPGDDAGYPDDSICVIDTAAISKLCFDANVCGDHYTKKTLVQLESYSLNEVRVLLNGLSKAVEEISSQLVQLLLENNALQEESDARNIAIEQLLKITVNATESELKPVQMSIILPSNECTSDEDS